MERRAILVRGSDIPSRAPCCEQAAEMDYRRGYYNGWKDAIWHLSAFCPEWLGARLERFLTKALCAWRNIGYAQGGMHGDFPPRFDSQAWGRSEKTAGVIIGPRRRFEILKRDHYRCQLCGVSAGDGPHVRLEVDHIIAKARGGNNTPENLHTLCEACNRGKHTKLL